VSCECCVLSVQPADHLSRAVLPTVVCLTECNLEASTMKMSRATSVVEPRKKNIKLVFVVPISILARLSPIIRDVVNGCDDILWSLMA
jgi:hypothetical protein